MEPTPLAGFPVNCSGFGQVECSKKSDFLLTSGEDGRIMWTDTTTMKRDTTREIQRDGMISAFALLPDEKSLLLVSDDDHTVYEYSLPDCKMSQIVCRSTVAVNHLSTIGSLIAVASEDPVVKILEKNTDDSSFSVKYTLEGHDADVKSVVLSPTGAYVASISTDGSCCVWSILNGGKLVSRMNAVVTESQRFNDDMLGRMAWHPEEKMLVVPGQKEIELRDPSSQFKLVDRLAGTSGHRNPVSIVSYSSNGLYVASSDVEKNVLIWDVEARSCLRSYEPNHVLTSMMWSTRESALVCLDLGGKCSVVKDAIPTRMTKSNAGASAVLISAKKSKTHESSKKVSETASKFIEAEAMDDASANEEGSGEDDDDDEENASSVNALKAQFGFNEDNQTRSDFKSDKNNDDMAFDDDEGGFDAAALDTLSEDDNEMNTNIVSKPPTKRQEPFQPGHAQHNSSTIFAWTPFGEIESISSPEVEYNVIKIDFADKSKRSLKFNDQYMFKIAAMDANGAVFASKSSGNDDDDGLDDPRPSFLFYRAFDSWSNSSYWSVPMEEGENISVVATGGHWCAAATTSNVLRIYNNTSGVIKSIVRLPGTVVSMVGSGPQLAIVYYPPTGEVVFNDAGAPLAYRLLRINESSTIDVLSTGPLPLSTVNPNSVLDELKFMISQCELSWVGFTDCGMLLALDSFGCLQVLSASMGYQWVPILVKNQVKALRECSSIWIVGVLQDKMLYFALPEGASCPSLRGKQRPVPSQLTLTTVDSGDKSYDNIGLLWRQLVVEHQQSQVLLEHHQKEKRALELRLLKQNNDSVASLIQSQTSLDKELLRLMKQFCGEDRPERALDLATGLQLEKSMSIALRIAEHYGFNELSNRISDLQESRFPIDFEEEFEEEEAAFVSSSQTHDGATKYKPLRNESPVSHYNNIMEEEEEEEAFVEMDSQPVEKENSIPKKAKSGFTNPFAKNKDATLEKRKSIPQLLEDLKSPITKKQCSR